MKGFNLLELSQETVIEALQCWVDQQFALGKSPKVTRVEAVENKFVVHVRGVEQVTEGQ